MTVPHVPLEVDLSARVGVIRPLHGVNLGPVQMNGWFDFSKSYKELGFPHTRLHDCPYAVPETVDIHSIFPNFDADPRDPRSYRFLITDDYIQAIIDTGSQVIYRLGETIEHHTRRKYFIHPPANFQKWAEVCVHIIRHYNEGWANGFRHNIRYWEIWNEPWSPKCWTGSAQDYYRLYEVAAKAIKAHDHSLKVGGPSSDGGGPGPFSMGFLEHCRETHAPLDFFSWHIYARDPAAILGQSVALREMLARHGFSYAESHLNEWNYLPSEGWRFNSPEKDPDCIRRAISEISGMPGAAFDAATLVHMQDCPIDVANFYWARHGMWGLWDDCGAARKNFHAFRAFRSLLDTPHRVRTTPNDPLSGHALLAGVADGPAAGILLVNHRARETDFLIEIKEWPWKGRAICRRHLVDDSRDLALVGQDTLDSSSRGLHLCLPAPTFCFLTLAPG